MSMVLVSLDFLSVAIGDQQLKNTFPRAAQQWEPKSF